MDHRRAAANDSVEPGNLTSRELGVLGLVAERLPNAQIAG
jgi:DNA-binding NarL/FixJ family response regulator